MTAIATPKLSTIPERIYRLRWRFEFREKSYSPKGTWNGAGGNKAPQAWQVDKRGMTRALIEGEDIRTGERKILLEVDAADYVTAQWEAYAKTPAFMAKGEMTIRPDIYALSFWTRKEKLTVDIGGGFTKRYLTQEEKKFNFLEHKAGT